MYEPLELLLDAGTELARILLGPEILGRARRAADRERYQVVFLEMPERLVCEAVVRDALDLELVRLVRRRANCVGPVRDANRLPNVALPDAGVERSRRAVRVWQSRARKAP